MGIKAYAKTIFIFFLIMSLFFLVGGCASRILKYDKEEELRKNDEFAKAVKIVVSEPPPDVFIQAAPTELAVSTELTVPTATSPTTTISEEKKDAKKMKKEKPKKKKKKEKKPKEEKKEESQITESIPIRRQPEIESDDGFEGRRPIKDPFRVGEKVVHDISYSGLTAGQLTMEVKPWAQVNGRKSYHFDLAIRSTSLFSKFYAVDDSVTTLLDYESLVPSVYTLAVKESSQLREAQMFFDYEENHAKFWEKKVTEKDGMQERKLDWEISPFSQNVFSTLFYLRVFKWDVGTKNAFHVAHDEENLVFKATALRREVLTTDLGEFTTLVLNLEIELKGFFKPIGENMIWISDDDRKLILRIESKIKIGSLISEVVEIQSGIP